MNLLKYWYVMKLWLPMFGKFDNTSSFKGPDWNWLITTLPQYTVVRCSKFCNPILGDWSGHLAGSV